MKNFLIIVDVDNPLWQKFKDWVKKEHGLHTDKEAFQTGNLAGMYKGSSVFVDSLDMNVIDVPVITLEEWDELVNGFVLPEKWCVRGSKGSVVHKWFKQKLNRSISYNHKVGRFYHFPEPRRNVCTSLYISLGYTEITLEQFKKYVLKEEADSCVYVKDYILHETKNPPGYKGLLDWAKREQKSLLYGTPYYSIKDLSEGKVAVVNDGTKEELEEVLKVAFPRDKTDVNSVSLHWKYYTQHEWYSKAWATASATSLPTQSVKEFYKQLKIEKMDNRFPFRLNVVDAQRIIDSACRPWKETLAEQWGKQILVDKLVTVSEQFYNNMRKACTEPQNKLFDEIFGSDEEQFKVGDWVVWTGHDKYVGRINKACPSFPGCWNIRLDKSDRGSYTSCHVTNLRKATPEEIAKAQCPYEDGELCWVKISDTTEYLLRYATGECDSEGYPKFYMRQVNFGSSSAWTHHKSAKGIELPKD